MVNLPATDLDGANKLVEQLALVQNCARQRGICGELAQSLRLEPDFKREGEGVDEGARERGLRVPSLHLYSGGCCRKLLLFLFQFGDRFDPASVGPWWVAVYRSFEYKRDDLEHMGWAVGCGQLRAARRGESRRGEAR